MPDRPWWDSLIGQPGLVVDLSGPGDWAQKAARVDWLAAGARVAVCDRSPLSALRVRRFARRAGIRTDREYALLPGPGGPGFAVELQPAAGGYFWRHLFALPTGPSPLLLLAGLAALGGRTRVGSLLLWAFAPGRLLLGTRA